MATKKIEKISDSGLRISPRFRKAVLLDDSTIDIFINLTILKESGIALELHCKENADDFFLELERTKLLDEIPDLIFLSLHLKNDSALKFLKSFSQLSDFVRNKCKIVTLSSLPTTTLSDEALRSPSVIRMLRKPLDVCQLNDFHFN